MLYNDMQQKKASTFFKEVEAFRILLCLLAIFLQKY
jgi:hypothetical protein